MAHSDVIVVEMHSALYERKETEIWTHPAFCPGKRLEGLCRRIDDLRRLQKSSPSAPGSVPVLVLFQEKKKPDAAPAQARQLPMRKIYLFQDEHEALSEDAPRHALLTGITEKTHAHTTFLAAARYNWGMKEILPLGSRDESWINDRDEDGTPRPWNVDRIMEWLLMVTGCIPVNGIYEPNRCELKDYYLERPQFRHQNPRYQKSVPAEAMARCILFANPGRYDKMFLCNDGDRAKTIYGKVMARPDFNAD